MKNTKSVAQYVDGRLVARYRSIAVAAALTGARANHISEVANGIRKTAGNSAWKFSRFNNTGTVVAATSEGQAVASYPDLNTALEVTNIPASRLSQAVAGVRKTAGGFVWNR